MRRVLATAVVFLLIPVFAHAQDPDLFKPENECNKPGAWAEYEELVRKYPKDKSVKILHALRIGLCVKLAQGSIDHNLAVGIFDEAHKTAIEKVRSGID